MPRVRWRLAAQLALGLVLGLVAFRMAVPCSAWSAGADGFRGTQDELTYAASLRYFVWDDWRWPLLRAAGFGSDAGSNILFSDAIPAYALGLRLVRRLVTPETNLLALWMAFCYAAQGVAAVASLRMWGVRRWLPLLAGACLAVSVPAWLERFHHSALCLQAGFLLAAGLPGLARRISAERAAALALLLAWALLAVNPYLFTMTAVLTVAFLGWLVDRGWSPRRALAAGALLAIGSLLEMALLGHFERHGVQHGFSSYSMNLLSPVVPPDWSLLGKIGVRLDAQLWQLGEGFNYLGLGLLLLLASALWLERSRLRRYLRRHRAYAFALGGLALFSLSTSVRAGTRLLLELPEPPDWIAQFRAPGRFFWPVTYFLLVAVVVVLARRGRRAEWALTVVALLQWADVQSLRTGIHWQLTHPPRPFLAREVVAPLIARHSRVVVAPSWDCAAPDERYPVTEVIFRASATRRPVSTAYSARPLPVDCARDLELRRRQLADDPDALAVVFDSATPVVAPRQGRWRCARFAGGRVCSAREDAVDLLRAVGPLDP